MELPCGCWVLSKSSQSSSAKPALRPPFQHILLLWTILNCLLGMNLTNLICISGNSEPGEYCVFSQLHPQAAPVVCGPFQGYGPCGHRCQSTHLSVLVEWFSGPTGCQNSFDSFMEWINKDNLKYFICEIFANPVRIEDSQSPTTGIQLSPQQQTEGFWQALDG